MSEISVVIREQIEKDSLGLSPRILAPPSSFVDNFFVIRRVLELCPAGDSGNCVVFKVGYIYVKMFGVKNMKKALRSAGFVFR